MDYNILIGGSAGQGMETMAAILEKVFKREGFQIFTVRDYMSRIRGGHNFIQVRFGGKKITSHRDSLDVIIALNNETIDIHYQRLVESGIVLCDDGAGISRDNILKLPWKTISKEAGNVKVFGSAAIGSVLKLFGTDTIMAEKVFGMYFSGDILEQNMRAFKSGYTLTDIKYEIIRSNMTQGTMPEDEYILINGNEAVALGAIAAGCKFYAAYPMTPSTSIMNYLASKMEDAEIVVEQAEDEIAAINMAIGASYAGARSMTGTSGGGFSLMVEGLGLSGMQEIPLVIAEIQRPGPATGFPTRTEQGDLKFVISASHGEFPRMVIALRNPEDAFHQTIRAFNLADKYRIPVILLGDQYLADYTTTVKAFDMNKIEIKRYLNDGAYMDGKEYKSYEITTDGISPRILPGSLSGQAVLADSDEHDEYGHITESAEVRVAMNDKRMRKLDALRHELKEPEFLGAVDFGILLLSWGSLHGPVSEAIDILNESGGKKYGALVFGDIWPLPVKLLTEKAVQAVNIINIEQNSTGQLASIIMECTGIKCTGSILKYDGRPISAGEIVLRLKV